MPEISVHPLTGPPQNPDPTLHWGPSDESAPGDASRPAASFAACAAASILLPCTGGTPTSFPPSSLPGSTVPGSCGSRSAPGLAQSPESATVAPSSVPGCSHTGTSIPATAPHDMHAARSPGRPHADSSRPGGAARASQFFCQHILEHHFIQRQFRHQPLEPTVLFLELFELSHLIRLQPLVLLLPSIEGLLRDSHLADQLRHRHPHFRLLQHRHNLLHRKTLPLHGESPFLRF